MKKIISLFLALCTVLTLAVFPVSASPKTEVLECVEDGGFNNENLSPYWSFDAFTENPTRVADPENAQNYVLRVADVNTADTASVYAVWDVQNLVANTEINISADVYREDFHLYTAQMYIDFFKTEAPDYGNAYSNEKSSVNLVFDDRNHDNSWQTFTLKATVPADALSARVALSTKNGEILVDNFSIKATKNVYTRVGSELVSYGGFETMDSNGIPVGFGAAKDAFDSGVLSVSDDVRAGAGGKSVKITQKGTNPYAMIGKTGTQGRYYDFVDGETYTVSLWKKSPYMSKYWNFKLAFEFYSEDEVAQELQLGTASFYLGNGGANNWTKYEDELIIPEGTKMFRMFISITEAGDYYVDDISIMGSKKPQSSNVGVELIKNGSFESATGWSNFYGHSFNDRNTVYWASDIGMNNSGGFGFTADTAAYQTVNLTGGNEYTLSMYSKGDSTEARMEARIYFKNSAGADIDNYIIPVWASNTWRSCEKTFYAPENAVSAVLYFYKKSGVNVYLDNTSLKQTGGKCAATLQTDEAFYYTGRTKDGKAIVTADLAKFPELAYATVDFAFLDGYVKASKKGVAFVNGKAEFTYSMSLFSEKKKEYTVEAVIRDGAGTAIQTLKKKVYRYDRPSRIGEDGIYRINGKEIDPVFAYHVDVDDYPKCKEAGINVVMVSYWWNDMAADPTRIDTILAELEKNDLMGIFCLYRNMIPGGHPYNLQNTKKVVTKLLGSDRVYAYTLMDEPAQNDKISPEEDMRAGYKAIRDIDSEIPVFTVDNVSPEKLETVEHYSDILAVDPYPAGNGAPEHYVYDKVCDAIKASDGVKPVYSVLQTFDWREYFPTGDVIRHMVYQSFAAGAKGIGYFKILNAEGTTKLYNTDRWQALKTLAEKEYPLLFSTFARGVQPTLSSVQDSVFYVKYPYKYGSFMVVINLAETAKTVTVPMEKGYSLTEIRTNAFENGETFSRNLAKGEMLAAFVWDASIKNGTYLYSGEKETANVIPGELKAQYFGALSEAGSYSFMVALYKKVNNTVQLVDLGIDSIIASDNEQQLLYANVTVPDDSNVYFIKTFLSKDIPTDIIEGHIFNQLS